MVRLRLRKPAVHVPSLVHFARRGLSASKLALNTDPLGSHTKKRPRQQCRGLFLWRSSGKDRRGGVSERGQGEQRSYDANIRPNVSDVRPQSITSNRGPKLQTRPIMVLAARSPDSSAASIPDADCARCSPAKCRRLPFARTASASKRA